MPKSHRNRPQAWLERDLCREHLRRLCYRREASPETRCSRGGGSRVTPKASHSPSCSFFVVVSRSASVHRRLPGPILLFRSGLWWPAWPGPLGDGDVAQTWVCQVGPDARHLVRVRLAGPACLPLIVPNLPRPTGCHSCTYTCTCSSPHLSHEGLCPVPLCAPLDPWSSLAPLPCPQLFPRLLLGLALRLQATPSGSTRLPQTLGLRAAPGGTHACLTPATRAASELQCQSPPCVQVTCHGLALGGESLPGPSSGLPRSPPETHHAPRLWACRGLMGGGEQGKCMLTCTLSREQFIPQGLVPLIHCHPCLAYQKTRGPNTSLSICTKTARQVKISERHTVCLI